MVWQRLRVDVSDCTTLPEISDLIIRELFRANGKAHCEEMISRIALTGTTALHEVLSRSDVLEDLRKHVNDSYASFFCDTMVDETQEPRDKQALREEGLFPAVFLRVAETQRSLPEEQIAFLQQEFLDRGLQMPSSCAGKVGQAVGAGRRPGARYVVAGGRALVGKYLEHIKMDAFGAFSNRLIGPFGPGMNVVFGRNEAGKTTFAQFVGGVLFGWEEARGQRNTYKPDNAERAGTLFFANEDGTGDSQASRIRNADGLQGDTSVADDIDRETYRTMFSLTSDELRQLRNTTDVTAKLLTAGSGTGASPAHALDRAARAPGAVHLKGCSVREIAGEARIGAG